MPGVNLSKLKGLIAENDLAHYEAAQIIGVTPTTFSRKMNGHAEFSLSEAKDLADFFNITIDELFFSNCVAETETISTKQNMEIAESA